MLETSHDVEKPYIFPNGMFMVVGVIDAEQPFEAVMKKQEDRGEHSSIFFISSEYDK